MPPNCVGKKTSCHVSKAIISQHSIISFVLLADTHIHNFSFVHVISTSQWQGPGSVFFGVVEILACCVACRFLVILGRHRTGKV